MTELFFANWPTCLVLRLFFISTMRWEKFTFFVEIVGATLWEKLFDFCLLSSINTGK